MPRLRVVPLETIRRHEEVDPLRVDRLATRIEAEGTQVNPIICTEGPGGRIVLLDGATRRAALRRLDLTYAVVQMVDAETVTLEPWHHVVRNSPPGAVLRQIEAQPELRVGPDNGTPRLVTPTEEPMTIHPDGVGAFAGLVSLVGAYVGRWKVNRVIDPSLDHVAWRFPDWSAVVEFPALTMEDVMKAATGDDRLPAGITRFLIPDRALRLNVDLALLRAPGSELGKQEMLDRLIEERARAGRIRRYEESVFILDD
jgi:hypothetical protein